MANNLDVIVHGTCTTDILFSGLPCLPSPGEEVYSKWLGYTVGGSFITAAALARLGVRVAVICPLGTDQFSGFIRSTIKSEGITSLAYETNRPQANVSVCMSDSKDRAIASYSDDLSETDYLSYSLEVLTQTNASILHVSVSPNTVRLIERAENQGMFVSMDVGWDEAWLRNPEFLEVISRGNLFIPNDREACTITDTDTPEEAIRILKQYVPNVIVKCGAEGALCWSEAHDVPIRVPGHQVSEVIDTTGAGDNFDAGALYGLLQKVDLHTACMIGNICGSVSVQGLGGTGYTASFADVERVLAEERTGQQIEDI